MSTPLCALGDKYGVDKCPTINHNYTPTYHSVLDSRRDTTLHMLEIGVGNIPLMRPIVGDRYKPGASLRMWRDYFPKAEIIGCDIDKKVLFNDEDRIKTFYADQSNEPSLVSLIEQIKSPDGKLDIILDDGSHNKDHQIFSFKILWPYIRAGGLYIIEDIWFTFMDEIANLGHKFNYPNAEVICKFRDPADRQGLVIFKKMY